MAKTKLRMSCAVTVQLICTFVYVYVKSRFSHDAAHINQRTSGPINAHLIPGIYPNTFINVHVYNGMGRDKTFLGYKNFVCFVVA